VSVEEGGGVAGVRESAATVGVEVEDEAGGESALEAVVEAAVEAREDEGGRVTEIRKGADGADDEGDGHGGAEAFAADVAESDDVGAVGQGDDLEEVAADFLGGAVGAGEGVAGERGESFGNEDLEEFLGGEQLLLDGLLAAESLARVGDDGVDDGEQEQEARQVLEREAVAGDGEERGHEAAAEGPVGEAAALLEGDGNDGAGLGDEGGGGDDPDGTVEMVGGAVAGAGAEGEENGGENEDDGPEFGDGVDGGERAVGDLARGGKGGVGPVQEAGEAVKALGNDVDGDEGAGPADEALVVVKVEEMEEQQPEGDVGEGLNGFIDGLGETVRPGIAEAEIEYFGYRRCRVHRWYRGRHAPR